MKLTQWEILKTEKITKAASDLVAHLKGIRLDLLSLYRSAHESSQSTNINNPQI